MSPSVFSSQRMKLPMSPPLVLITSPGSAAAAADTSLWKGYISLFEREPAPQLMTLDPFPVELLLHIPPLTACLTDLIVNGLGEKCCIPEIVCSFLVVCSQNMIDPCAILLRLQMNLYSGWEINYSTVVSHLFLTISFLGCASSLSFFALDQSGMKE